MTRFRLFIITTTVFISTILMLAAYFFVFPLVTNPQGLKYTVRSGSSIGTVIQDLTTLNVIKHPSLIKLLVKLRRDSHQLKAGEYYFQKGTTANQLLTQVTTGKGIVYHTFTIIAGWNFVRVQEQLQNEPSLQHTINSLTPEELMAKIGAPGLNPEGEFFPDTYYFTEGSSDIALLKRAYLAMQEKLNTAWQQRDPDLMYQSPYEVLIVASLIEKEAEVEADRAMISGVIVNRLKKNMLLQIDPTVIYGMGQRYTGTIRKSDLQADTPYNTYTRKGLPPTPIAMPGMESILAAVHPAKHDYFYFVVKGQGEASHQFSKTLTDHNTAVTAARKTFENFFNTELVRLHLLKIFNKTN